MLATLLTQAKYVKRSCHVAYGVYRAIVAEYYQKYNSVLVARASGVELPRRKLYPKWVGLVQWLKLLTLISRDGVRFSAKAAVFSVFSSRGLSLGFMCSDQHVKYRIPCGFLLTSSLLLDYHVKQCIYTHINLIQLGNWLQVTEQPIIIVDIMVPINKIIREKKWRKFSNVGARATLGSPNFSDFSSCRCTEPKSKVDPWLTSSIFRNYQGRQIAENSKRQRF